MVFMPSYCFIPLQPLKIHVYFEILFFNLLKISSNFEECQWSRKQAELFTAQQANLLQINEKKALPPKQLQKTITQIMNDIPEYPDVVSSFYTMCIM